ncbi:hypothetical protein BJ322DRAFT_151523 [Thelephora terrestris]|uniref:F-box domain-containing protein n=1 Tax=Thelephora terrestris TaxID=56493 RepID=A0A9P6HBP2_9AGAM|nr:hypothetical protein BJ322DRAFT_151523 [Thelephora terrestris]
MSSQTYPGKGLSPLQLVFALNEELKHTAFSSSLTADQLAQLRQDTLLALSTICEWGNSFTGIGRIPSDVLALIPIHLSSQKDRLRASFVCRRWRRTFLQCAELWSELFLLKGEACLKTFLDRAKGSALDVIVDAGVPASTMGLLSSHTKQFRSLHFTRHKLRDVQMFLRVNSGPLPLLHTLEISTGTEEDGEGASGAITPPSTPLFNHATNLKAFGFYSDSGWSPSLGYFTFPHLTSLSMSVKPHGICGSQLLDMLEASPMLRDVYIEAMDFVGSDLRRVPKGRVVVLDNVDSFDLCLIGGERLYQFAVHISCPSASSTSLSRSGELSKSFREDALPTPDEWHAIVHQYTRNPAEEVAFELLCDGRDAARRFAFRSPDGSVLKLCFEGIKVDPEYPSLPWRPTLFIKVENPREQYDVYPEVARIVLDHPHVANFRRLRVCDNFAAVRSQDATRTLRLLFKSLGSLDELTFHNCHPQPYFDSFSDFCEDGDKQKAITFTPIKQLTISHCEYHKHLTRIENLAESQHALGVPFERIIFRDAIRSQEIEQKLRTWVDSVEYCYSSLKERETSIVE